MDKKRLLRFSLWLMPWHIIALSLLAPSFLSVIDVPNDFLTRLYLPMAFISQFTLIVLLVFLVTLPLLLLPFKRLVLTLIVLIYVCLLFYFWIDSLVFQQYRFHINAFVIELLLVGGRDIFDFSYLTWAKIILSFLVILTIEYWGLKKLWQFCAKKHPLAYANTVIIFLIMLTSQTIHAWSYANGYLAILKLTPAVPYYFPLKSHEWVAMLNLKKSANKPLTTIAKKSGRLIYPKQTLSCQQSTKTNLVMIVVDALRFDMLKPSTMPHSYAFAQNNLWFKNHFSGGNGSRTGIFSLFYGVPGVYWNDFKQTRTSSILIDTLQKNDYQLNILASARLTAPAFHQTVFANVPSLRLETAGDGAGQKDKQITREFSQFIDNKDNNKPFFSFLFYDAVHGYDSPADFDKPFLPELKHIDYFKLKKDYDPTLFFNRYKNSVFFVDTLIKQVVDKLKQSGDYDNTTLIITADHGQEFNDNGLNYWGHGSNFSRYQLQVPMIIKTANKQKQHLDYKTTHLDIVPTLMQDLFNCTNPISDYSLGQHILDKTPRHYFLAGIKTNYAVVTDTVIAVDNNINFLQFYEPNYQTSTKRLSSDIYPQVVRDLSWFYTP